MVNDRALDAIAIRTLAKAVEKGDRRALARAITLAESTRADHRAAAAALLETLLPRTGGSLRIGISGAPGVGKSTLIEALGVHAIAKKRRPAVLAVDPSSPVSGGSILGDKTRMAALSRSDRAFVRPSPSGGALGGIAPRTQDAILLCEAAGFDTVLVETVGVGQSEIAVAGVVDLFILVLAPAGGDELQGIKRGILELADLILVNKADGDWKDAARRSAADYTSALALFGEMPQVLLCSALTGEGVPALWDEIEKHRSKRARSATDARRAEQARAAFRQEIDAVLRARLAAAPEISKLLLSLEKAVAAGKFTPNRAAQSLVDALLMGKTPRPRLTRRGKVP